ncbi:hypothetical protein V8F33_013558 [Rhypophila sp. PSN 637]
MRVFLTTSILAAFGCLVTLAGARVPKSLDDGSAKADMAVKAPAGTHTLDEAGLPTPPPPPPRPKAICCIPGCTGCTIRWCNVNECPDLLFNDCCAEEKLADAKFYTYDGHTELNVTLAELLAHVSSDDAVPDAGIDAVQGSKDVVAAREEAPATYAQDKSLTPMKNRATAEEAMCCTVGCLSCTTISCEHEACTGSIWFRDCCAVEITGPGQGHVTDATKFYDFDHNELNVTLAEVLAERISSRQALLDEATVGIENSKDEVVTQTEPPATDAQDKSPALTAPRVPSKEPAICCMPGCLKCTTMVCEEEGCTASIWFGACCATEVIIPDAKFYDPDHNELDVTRAEFFAMIEAGAQGAHN